MNTYKALIIDDEIDNITLLKINLNKYCPNIKIIEQATNVADGIELFIETLPDLLFLDINLGEEDSFMFLDSVSTIDSEIIFVSSYKDFGIKIINNYKVTGFITKPIDVYELKKTVNKAIVNIKSKEKLKSLELENNSVSLHHQTNGENLNLIAIPSASKIDIIHAEDIVYLEADGRYTIFHLTNGNTKIASKNLGEYEKQLNHNIFFRIHNRYLVNLNMVININKSAGNYCELLNDKALPIAKRRQESLRRFFNLK